MIRIKRKDSKFIEEEFVSENDIHRCWKEKVIDKQESWKASWCDPFAVMQKNLKSLGYVGYKIKGYKDNDGNNYAYLEEDYHIPIEDYDRLNGKHLNVGWNKIDIIPEEYHYKYLVEITRPNTESTTRRDWGGMVRTDITAAEIVEIDEETYNKLIGKGEIVGNGDDCKR